MATYIGITCGHCATIAVTIDGTLVFCQSEERLLGLKNAAGFPHKTWDYVLGNIVKKDEVTAVVFNAQNPLFNFDPFIKRAKFQPFDPSYYLSAERVAGMELIQSSPNKDEKLCKIAAEAESARRAHDSNPEVITEAIKFFSNATGVSAENLLFADHHTTHAYSALPILFGRSGALIFTLDGYGDELSASVGTFSGAHYELLSSTPRNCSLGKLYKTVTGILGFKCGTDEHKVMGLAPYASGRQVQELSLRFSELLSVKNDGTFECAWHNYADLQYRLEKLLRYQRFDVSAAAVQLFLERTVCQWISYWIKRTGVSVVGLAGGVFMNIKLNKAILQLPGVSDLYVVPSAGDESTAIGAAIWASATRDRASIPTLSEVYLGHEITQAEIEAALVQRPASNISVETPSDIEDRVAGLLADQCIVARAAGRMEFGARALGNRSILSDPSNLANAKKINDTVKGRDFWMPFAPSILEEDAPRYIENPKNISSPFMMVGFDSKASSIDEIRAGLHPHDFTLRPHIVSQASNPSYHAIIQKFRNRTGRGAVLNTSFNIHGKPIVCTVLDALTTFQDTNLEYLQLGSLLISKRR